MEARVTAHSQAHRLRERMAQAEVQHGQEIRADLPGIGVIATGRDWFTARHKDKGEVFLLRDGADPGAEGDDLRRRGPAADRRYRRGPGGR